MFHGQRIREYIQSHKNYDSEYWYTGNGDYYILSQLMRYTENDWQYLVSNIPNWDFEEIEILILSISNLDSYYNEFDQISVERSRLFTECFTLLPQINQTDYLDELSEILDLPNWDKNSLKKIKQKLDEVHVHYSGEPNLEQAIFRIKNNVEDKLKVSR
ncbi:MAG: hypothetical protein ACSHXL_06650 [Bacteroidota bacterium]